ncbi:MAG: peptidylprolyl isomerase [Planctomycetota bacterium]
MTLFPRCHPVRLLPLFAIALVLIAGCQDEDQQIKDKYKALEHAPQIDPDKNPRIQITLDSPKAVLNVELLEHNYPAAVNRFMALLIDGYYNDQMAVHVPGDDDKNLVGTKPQIMFECSGPVSKSGYNGIYFKEAQPKEPSLAVKLLSAGKLAVPKVPDPRTFGFLITKEADPALDAKYIAIGEVIKGQEVLKEITDKTTVTNIEVTRYSREASAYVLPKDETPPPVQHVSNEPEPEALIHTDQGDVKILLDEDAAPNTVGNFVYLVDKGFYDGLTFHRIEDWVVQGGDPTGTGSGGPGYNFYNEINWDSLKLSPQQEESLTKQGFKSTPGLQSLHNVVGAVAMAHAGPGTNGSQFFILRKPAAWLDGKHTVFGKVIEGMDNVMKWKDGSKVKILSIKMLRQRNHKYVSGDKGPCYDPLTTPATGPGVPAPTPENNMKAPAKESESKVPAPATPATQAAPPTPPTPAKQTPGAPAEPAPAHH